MGQTSTQRVMNKLFNSSFVEFCTAIALVYYLYYSILQIALSDTYLLDLRPGPHPRLCYDAVA